MALNIKLPFERYDGVKTPWKHFRAQFQAYLVTKNIVDLGLQFPPGGFLTGLSESEQDSILFEHGFDSEPSNRASLVRQFDSSVRLIYQHLVLATTGDALSEVLLHETTCNGYLAFCALAHRFRGSTQLHASQLFRELRSLRCSGTSREDVQSFYTQFRTLLVDLASCGQALAPQLAYEFYRDALPSSLDGLKLSAAGSINFEDPAGLALYHENIVRILKPSSSSSGHAHVAAGSRPTITCHNCGKPGHKRNECRSRPAQHGSGSTPSSCPRCARCKGPHDVQCCDKASITPSSKCRKCQKGFHWSYDCRSTTSRGSANQALTSAMPGASADAPATSTSASKPIATFGNAKSVIAEAVPAGFVVPGPNSYIFTAPPTANIASGNVTECSVDLPTPGSVVTTHASPGFALRSDATVPARICLDSGASHHMSPDRELFSDLRALDHSFSITCADKQQISASAIGTLSLPLKTTSGIATLHFNNVYYVPELLDTLVSMGSLIDSPNRVHVADRENLRVDFVLPNNTVTTPLELNNRLLYFHTSTLAPRAVASVVCAVPLPPDPDRASTTTVLPLSVPSIALKSSADSSASQAVHVPPTLSAGRPITKTKLSATTCTHRPGHTPLPGPIPMSLHRRPAVILAQPKAPP
eukprot:Colp12_sorted_trinity150504_noHs@19782